MRGSPPRGSRGTVLDRDLILRARRGDEDAFDAIVARHGRLVLGIARRVARSADDADEIAQEAFLRFYRALERVDPDRPLEPWLARITLNAARSWVGRRPAAAEPLTGSEAAPGSVRPAESAADARRVLAAAAATLPRREREVFVLRDLQGMETRLVAESLEISSVTVRRHSMEARRKVEAWIRVHRPEMVPAAGERRDVEKTRSTAERPGDSAGSTE